MEKEVERVYATFLTRVVRKPQSDCNRDLLPRWFVCPDYPVPKHRKMDLAEVTVNHGRHMHGIGLMPPVSRMKEGLEAHFATNQRLMCVMVVCCGFMLKRLRPGQGMSLGTP